MYNVIKTAQEGVRLQKDPPKGYRYNEAGNLVPIGWSEFHEEGMPSDSLDTEALRKGVSMAESLGGVLMMNPTSSATGAYGQLFKEIENLPEMKDVTREQFANNPKLQEHIFNKRLEEGLGERSLRRNAEELTEEYKDQLGDKWEFSLNDVAALSNYLGRDGTRKFFGSIRDGGPVYTPSGVNKPVMEYLDIVRNASYKD
tara:strand:- start:974 stop:1573 length:600 start_codon:yes stop_codon:yes gene_type:complete